MNLQTGLIGGLADRDRDDPTVVLEYAVRTPDGQILPYGDQSWVACGKALEDHESGSTIVRRINLISYGAWVETGPEYPPDAMKAMVPPS